MYNRKFNIKKDFHELVELEHKIFPLLEEIKDDEKKELLKNYIRKIFDNQFKK